MDTDDWNSNNDCSGDLLSVLFKKLVNNDKISKLVWSNVHKINVLVARHSDLSYTHYPRAQLYKYHHYTDCVDAQVIGERFGLGHLKNQLTKQLQSTTPTIYFNDTAITNYQKEFEEYKDSHHQSNPEWYQQMTQLLIVICMHNKYSSSNNDDNNQLDSSTFQRKIEDQTYFNLKAHEKVQLITSIILSIPTVFQSHAFGEYDIKRLQSQCLNLIQIYNQQSSSLSSSSSTSTPSVQEDLSVLNLCWYFRSTKRFSITKDIIRRHMYSLELVDGLLDLENHFYSDLHLFDTICKYGSLEQVIYLHNKLEKEYPQELRATFLAMDSAAKRKDQHHALGIVKFLHQHRNEQCTQQAILDNNNSEVVKYLLHHKPSLARYYSIQNAIMSLDLSFVKYIQQYFTDHVEHVPLEHRNNSPVVISRYLVDEMASRLSDQCFEDMISYLFQHFRDQLPIYHLFSSSCCHGRSSAVKLLHSLFPVDQDKNSGSHLISTRARTTILDDSFLVGMNDDLTHFLISERHDVGFGEDTWSFIGESGSIEQLKMVQKCSLSRTGTNGLEYHDTTITKAIRHGNMNIIKHYYYTQRELYDKAILPSNIAHSFINKKPEWIVKFYLKECRYHQVPQPILGYLFYQSLVYKRVDIAKELAKRIHLIELDERQLNHIFSLEKESRVVIQYLLQIGQIKQEFLDSLSFYLANVTVSNPTIKLIEQFINVPSGSSLSIPNRMIKKNKEKKEKEKSHQPNNNNPSAPNPQPSLSPSKVLHNRYLLKKILSFTYLPSFERLDWSKIDDATILATHSPKLFHYRYQEGKVKNINKEFVSFLIGQKKAGLSLFEFIMERHFDLFDLSHIEIAITNNNVRCLELMVNTFTKNSIPIKLPTTKPIHPPSDAMYHAYHIWKLYDPPMKCTDEHSDKSSFFKLTSSPHKNVDIFVSERMSWEEGTKSMFYFDSFSPKQLIIIIHDPRYTRATRKRKISLEKVIRIASYDEENKQPIIRFIHQNYQDVRYLDKSNFEHSIYQYIETILHLTQNQYVVDQEANGYDDSENEGNLDFDDDNCGEDSKIGYLIQPLDGRLFYVDTNFYFKVFGLPLFKDTLECKSGSFMGYSESLSNIKDKYYRFNIDIDWSKSRPGSEPRAYRSIKAQAIHFYCYMGMPFKKVFTRYQYDSRLEYHELISTFYPLLIDSEIQNISDQSLIEKKKKELIFKIRRLDYNMDYSFLLKVVKSHLLRTEYLFGQPNNYDEEENNQRKRPGYLKTKHNPWQFLFEESYQNGSHLHKLFIEPKPNGFYLSTYAIDLLDTIRLDCPTLSKLIIYHQHPQKDLGLVQWDTIKENELRMLKEHISFIFKCILKQGTSDMFDEISRTTSEYSQLVQSFLDSCSLQHPMSISMFNYLLSKVKQEKVIIYFNTVNLDPKTMNRYKVIKEHWLRIYTADRDPNSPNPPLQTPTTFLPRCPISSSFTFFSHILQQDRQLLMSIIKSHNRIV